VGKRIMAQGTPSLKRVFLELGGKSASILLDDVDIEVAAANALMVLFHAGQGCAHLTRLLVPRAKHAAAVEVLKGRFENVPYGDYDDPSQVMGLLISERQRKRVLDYVEIGKVEGARPVCCGGIPEHRSKGYFVWPTLFANVNNSMRIAREAIFGRVRRAGQRTRWTKTGWFNSLPSQRTGWTELTTSARRIELAG
jgi:aldehyde dehydrogenase (NAD+)